MPRLLIAALLIGLTNTAWSEELEDICRYCGRSHFPADVAGTGSGRKYAPDRKVDVLHIKIDVRPDFKARTIEAVTTLSFAPISNPVEQVQLNAEMLSISDVRSNVPLADWVATDHHLTLLFDRPIPVGQQVDVAVTYSAEPKQGLYFRTPELGYPAEDTHLWTQGETHEAPHWFPCFDYPNERSTTEVLCTVPADMTVLSNGRRVGEQDAGGGLKTVHWRMDKSHANYLVCLAAGYFHKLEDRYRDVPLGFYSQPSLAEHARNSFADTRTILEFYESEIGVPYPWNKYDQVTIRDFNSGGMENTTLTTLTHRTIFAEVSENIRSSRNLDAHETAHQWFGDYVTCEDWSHLWLNEGFATYYTHLYNEHKLGRDEFLYGLWRDAKNRVLPNGDDPRPIVFRDYENAWEQFDFRNYPKGSWVLHMLRNQLGKDVYRQGIKTYLETNALQSVVTPDLIAALENASGQELDKFFDQWVYHAGNPKLKVRYKWLPKEKLAHVSVEQTQETNDDVLLFEFPTVLRFEVGDQTIDHPVNINGKQHDFYVPLSAEPEGVRFDPNFTVLAEVDFDKPQKMLERQLTDSTDVVGRLLAVEALADKENKKSVAALQAALNSDPYYGIRIEAADALEQMHTDESFAALMVSQKQADARVRLQVVENIGKFFRPEARDALIAVCQSEPNPEVAAEAVSALGKFPKEDARRQIDAALATDSFANVIKLAAIDALGDSGDAEFRGKLLNLLKSSRNEFDSRQYAKALRVMAGLWRDADDKTPARTWIEQCLQDPAAGVRRGALNALGELGDPGAIALLQTYSDAEGSGRNQSAAQEAIKKLEEDAPFVPEEVRELREMIKDLKAEQKKLREQVDELKAKSDAADEASTK